MTQDTERHIWCNYFMRPREGCEMCEGLYRDYPMDDVTPDEMIAKYFPDVVVRTRNDATDISS